MSSSLSQPDDLPEILKVLEAEGTRRRKQGTAVRQVVVGLTAGYIAVALFLFVVKKQLDFSSIASFTSLFACVAAGVGMSGRHKEALDKAAEWQDPRLIPHLLEALDADKEEIKEEAKGALKVVLPLLDQECAPQFTLTSHQRRMLGTLGKSEDMALASAAIRSLAILGDRSTLKALDSLGDLTNEAGKPAIAKTAALAKVAAGDLRLRLAREQIEAEAERMESASQRGVH